MSYGAPQRFLASLTGRASRLDRLEVWSRVASLALTAVLIFSAYFSIEAARITGRASTAAKLARTLNRDFNVARYAVRNEESLNRKYRLEPGREIFLEHEASAAALVVAIRAILNIGDALDRSVSRDVLRRQKLYAAGTRHMYAAVDRHDAALALAFDRRAVDPVYDRLDRELEERGHAHAGAEDIALARLSDTQHWVIQRTIFMSVLGVASLGLFLAILLAYQRRLASSHRAQVEDLQRAALIDNLTGIGNHRAYQEDLGREVARAQRHGELLSLVLLDIDDFKVVNDRDGHMHGDEILTTLAKLLNSSRAEDRAYRIGGDEFALVLAHTSMAEALEAMDLLHAAVSAQLFTTTISIGLATLEGQDCDVETLQAQADAAMYSGKRAGRNGVTPFSTSMADMWLLSPKKIHNLRQLIAGGSMTVAFQPIWDVEHGSVLAYEALARPDSQFGFSGPQEAFDLAERIGRAHELDTVCRNAALAAARNLPAGALLFLNVSPQSLDHNRLDPDAFLQTVLAAGLTADRVVIEITERSITQVDAVIEAAKALQRRGFRLALDDTGSGNSGLEIMTRLTLEFVKIDRAVIVKAINDKNARGVMAGIVAIARATDAYVIAEGVENVEMLDFVCRGGQLKAHGERSIKGVQGFLLRRPSETFPDSGDDDIKALLKEYAVDDSRGDTATTPAARSHNLTARGS